MGQPLHTCMTKAVIVDGDRLRTGPKWIAARRGRLQLYTEGGRGSVFSFLMVGR